MTCMILPGFLSTGSIGKSRSSSAIQGNVINIMMIPAFRRKDWMRFPFVNLPFWPWLVRIAMDYNGPVPLKTGSMRPIQPLIPIIPTKRYCRSISVLLKYSIVPTKLIRTYNRWTMDGLSFPKLPWRWSLKTMIPRRTTIPCVKIPPISTPPKMKVDPPPVPPPPQVNFSIPLLMMILVPVPIRMVPPSRDPMDSVVPDSTCTMVY